MQLVEICRLMQQDANKCLIALAGVNQGLSTVINAHSIGTSREDLESAIKLLSTSLDILNDGLEAFAEHSKPIIEGKIYE